MELTNRKPAGEARQFVAHNLIASAGTLLAGALGFALQAAISHRLRPSEYAAAFAVLSLLNLLVLPAGAFTRLIAYETSRAVATSGPRKAPSGALLRSANRRLFVFGVVVALAVVATSPWVADFLRISPLYLAAGAVALPFMMGNPVVLGELQGEQRVSAWVSIQAGAALAKLIGAVVLGLLLGPIGVLLGVSLGAAVIYVINYLLVRRHMAPGNQPVDWSAAWRYIAVTVPAMVCMTLLMSTDVLLVKHLFNPNLAGEYSAVAALGRSSFWVVGGIGAVLFPKVAARAAKGESAQVLILASVAMAVVGGLSGLALFEVAGQSILGAFSGTAYLSGVPLLGPYALGMTMLGVAMVLVFTHQSMGRSLFLWVLVPAVVIQAVLIQLFHDSLMQVVIEVDSCLAFLVIGLGVVLAIEDRRTAARRGVAEADRVVYMVQPTLEPVLEEDELPQYSTSNLG